MKELSKKNANWIPNNRYLELKYFCFQYWDWKDKINDLGSMYLNYIVNATSGKKNIGSDPTYSVFTRQALYKDKCEAVEMAVMSACKDFNAEYMYDILLTGITTGKSYDILRVNYDHIVSRTEYYQMYRAAFFNLNMLHP